MKFRILWFLLLLLSSTPTWAAQLPNQCISTAAAGGTGDQITVGPLPCWPTSTLLLLKFAGTNATQSPTLSVAGQTAYPILDFNGTNLAIGTLQPGQYRLLSFTGSSWLVLSAGSIQSIVGQVAVANTTVLRATTVSQFPGGVWRNTDGVAGATPLFFTATVGSSCAVDDGASCVNGVGGHWNGQFPNNMADDAEFSVVGNGSTDDTTAFVNAVNWCNAGGVSTTQSRVLNIGYGRPLVNASPSINFGCTLTGSGTLTPSNSSNNPYAITSPTAILLGVGQSLLVASGTIQNLRVFPAALKPPTSLQDSLTKVAGFTGTGIIVEGADSNINHVLVIGFNQCIGSGGVGTARLTLSHVWIDCTNGLDLDSSHDVSSVSFIRGWPWFNGGNTPNYGQDTESISAVANNGSGAIRLTVGSTSQLATGNTAVVANVEGAVGANGIWPITVVDLHTIDLQGSQFASTTASGTETTGQSVVTGFSSIAGIWEGEAVSGTGVPAGTTVTAVDHINKYVWLSNLATATGSNSLTFTTGTYTSGGVLTVGGVRSGTFITVTNSEENHFTDLFEYGWQTGYNPSTGTQWQKFHNIGCDGLVGAQELCVLVNGNSLRSQFMGVNVTGAPIAYEDAATEGQGTMMRGLYLESAIPHISVILQNVGGSIDIDGHDNGSVQYVADYDTTGSVRFNGLFTGTFLLNPSLPAMLGTTLMAPIIAGNRTYTPSLFLGGANSGLTYAQHIGTYSMAPDGTMSVQFKIALSALGSSTGAATISLPYPCLAAAYQYSGTIGYFANNDSSVGSMMAATDPTDLDQVDLGYNGAGTAGMITNAKLSNTSQIFGALTCATR